MKIVSKLFLTMSAALSMASFTAMAMDDLRSSGVSHAAPVPFDDQTGTLTKTGSGTFTLSGANTYSGSTTLSKGTLTLLGDESGIAERITVRAGTVLRVPQGRYEALRDKLDVEEGGKVEIIE